MAAVQRDPAIGGTVAVAVELQRGAGDVRPIAHLRRTKVEIVAGESLFADELDVHLRQVDAVALTEVGDDVVPDVADAVEPEAVVARPTGQDVTPDATVQRVVAVAAGQAVGTAHPAQQVVARAAGNGVQTGPAVQFVVARRAGQRPVGHAHQDARRAPQFLQRMGTGQLDHAVGEAVAVAVDLQHRAVAEIGAEADRRGAAPREAFVTHEDGVQGRQVDAVALREIADVGAGIGVVAGKSGSGRRGGDAEGVVAGTAGQRVEADTVFQNVVAGTAGQAVVAGEAAQRVVAGPAGQSIASRRTVQRVVARRAGQRTVGHAHQDTGRARQFLQRRSVGQLDVAIGAAVAVAVDLQHGTGVLTQAHLGQPPIVITSGEGTAADEGGVQTGQVDAVAHREVGDDVEVVCDVAVVDRTCGEAEGVVPGPAGQAVVALAALQRIVAVAAGQAVVAAQTAQQVVAAAAADGVPGDAAGQRVVRRRAGERQVGHPLQHAGRAGHLLQRVQAGQGDGAVGIAVAVAVDLQDGGAVVLTDPQLGRSIVGIGPGKGAVADEDGAQPGQIDAVAVREVGDDVPRGVGQAGEAEEVVAGPAGQAVASGPAVQRVVAESAGQAVVAAQTKQQVIAVAAVDGVAPDAAGQRVGRVRAVQGLVGNGLEDAGGTGDLLQRRTTGQSDAVIDPPVAVGVDLQNGRTGFGADADLRRTVLGIAAGEGGFADEGGVQPGDFQPVA